jgi:4-amino-4-deoxy-L-arabinose transferase-like glycosyltransferase
MNQEPSILDFIKASIRHGFNQIFHLSTGEIDSEKPESLSGNQIPASRPAAGESTPEGQAGGSHTGAGTEDLLKMGKEGANDRGEEKAAGEAVPNVSNGGFLKNLFSSWRTWLAFGLALAAQLSLQPHQGAARQWETGFILFLLAGLVLVWANIRHEWSIQAWPASAEKSSDDRTFLRSSAAFIAALVFSLITFTVFKGGVFTWLNLVVWFLALLTMFWAFWKPGSHAKGWWSRVKDFASRPKWHIKLDRWALLVLAAFGLAIFFRTFRLTEVPSQMVSDHAEKLLDISRLLAGKTSVFFPNNGGREFFQFYLTAGIILLFKTGLTFMSLKIGTTLAGLVTLYFIYLLGKEIGNSRVGLLAMTFAGIAYWPNVISRFGLRLPMYPLFYAPALYFLILGLRQRNRNMFALSGLFLGLGLNGYTAYRVVPLVILVAIALYLLHKQSRGYRRQAVWGLIALVLISFIVFIPLLRYVIENPQGVIFRSMSRLGTWEQPLPGPAWQIFLDNFRKSLTMFSWDDGNTWPISVPNIPVLDAISSVLFHLGVVLLAIRYIRQKNWTDIFTLVSIPLLMLPSILSLAFPAENPSLSRSAGAIISVFLIVGLALDGLLKLVENMSASAWSKGFAWLVGLALLVGAGAQNYDLVFNQYRELYDASAWNTSEVGQVVRDFTQMEGTVKSEWLVAYPYWVDSRLVMINAGFPTQDDAIMPENLKDTQAVSGAKLFILNIQDNPSVETLKSLYPRGWVTEYQSQYPNKNFLIFFVPPSP